MSQEFTPHRADEVTEEIIELTLEIADSFYAESRIDWDDVFYRLDGTELADGRELWMPTDWLAPSIAAIKKAVNKARRS
ncbi:MULTISPECIES: hypothetical protein [unclassified Streptomyces]|uniref:hypothetical protein n=1 Tax=unclassified Streptomyces TaxID=2593676 RepID=UPI003809E0A5